MSQESTTDPQALVRLFRNRFLCRDDVIAFNAPWGKPCPVKVGDDLDALLLAHVLGQIAPKVTLQYRNSRGNGAALGPFRLGTYSPTPAGTTKWLCLDLDGGDHAEALLDPEATALQVWQRFVDAGIPAYLERSGGGKGWHLWSFFDQALAAGKARALAYALIPEEVTLVSGEITRTNTARGIEVFPKQSRIERHGYGNLIWLPWWFGARGTANQFHRIEDERLTSYIPDDFEAVPTERIDEIAADTPLPAEPVPAEPAPTEPISLEPAPLDSTWKDWRASALAALPLDAIYGEWLTGRPGQQGWLECRDPWSQTGDRDPSAGVSDGSGRAQRAEFHSFITGETLSVFDFLIKRGLAADITAASQRVAELSGIAVPTSRAQASPRGTPSRPQIRINNRQLRDVIVEAWKALLAANTPPTLFRRSDTLAHLVLEEGARIKLMDEATIYGSLVRAANWVKVTENATISISPTRDIARDMLAYPDLSLGQLDGVIFTPMFSPLGMLITEPGYHAEAQIWYHRDPGFTMPPVPDHPSPQQIEAARLFLLEELLVDFPFVTPTDLAHVIAAMLLPFVRRMIVGCTPIHLIESPTPGSGKSLLADLIALIATGRSCESTTITQEEDETRKKITSLLIKAPPIIHLDNVRAGIQSGQLAAAITAETWSDRILSLNRMITLPNHATWLVTANNPRLSLEVARRCIRIRIDPRTDRPWQRVDFRHSPLRSWVRKCRGKLVHALLVLVQAWIAAGCPHSSESLGSFENWAAITGGILTTAGIPGFLGNLEELYEVADVEGSEWREFIAIWWERYHDQWVRVKDLHDLALDENMMGSITGAKSPRSQQIRLGLALSSVRDRQFGKWRVVMRHDSHTKSATYRLAMIDSSDDPTAPADLATIPEEETT